MKLNTNQTPRARKANKTLNICRDITTVKQEVVLRIFQHFLLCTTSSKYIDTPSHQSVWIYLISNAHKGIKTSHCYKNFLLLFCLWIDCLKRSDLTTKNNLLQNTYVSRYKLESNVISFLGKWRFTLVKCWD